MPAKPKPRQPLSRERIVDTAIALVDAEGLDALTCLLYTSDAADE